MAYEKFYSTPLGIKLMLMYALNLYGKPIKNAVLSNCILENNDVNYFELQANLYDLVKKGEFYGFKEDGEYLYRITDDGKADIEFFQYKIPRGVKKRIDESMNKLIKREKPVTDVVADFMPEGKEFLVSMKVLENGIEQFGINTLVTRREIAEGVCLYLKNNAARLYKMINEEINEIFLDP